MKPMESNETNETNEYQEFSLSELWDLLDAEEARYMELLDEPINYYIPGDSMTYMSAMSQCWAQDSCRDKIKAIESEMSRRCSAKNNEKEA